MDEIELFKQIKKIVKSINLCIIFFFGSIGIISYGMFPYDTEILKFFSIIILLSIIFNLIIYLTIVIIYKLSYSKVDFKNINKEYYREVCNSYSPAIVSFLENMKIEVYRDYTATILELNVKKYIKIVNSDKDVLIYKDENVDLTKLKSHELYVYDCIINNTKFDEEEFKKLILKDAETEGLIKKEKMNFAKIIQLLMVLLIVVTLLVLSIKNNEGEIMAVMLLLILMPIMMYGKEIYKHILEKVMNKYIVTKKGKEELKKIKAFKNFIKEYTLIKEKDIDYIQILDEYIPYSLSLGTSPKIEEYIKSNEVYRQLIYKNKEGN